MDIQTAREVTPPFRGMAGLTIFAGERCVTPLDDLEAVAKAIQKAVCDSETSAKPSNSARKSKGKSAR